MVSVSYSAVVDWDAAKQLFVAAVPPLSISICGATMEEAMNKVREAIVAAGVALPTPIVFVFNQAPSTTSETPRFPSSPNGIGRERAPRVAEFFAGIGLVRMALERAGCRVVYANEIDAWRQGIYEANFDAAGFVCGDVREVHGTDIPDIEIATASFPCIDLSLAGNRAGLTGEDSGLVVEFLRILNEMGQRRPPVILLENVLGFATSSHGEDLRGAIQRLNDLGYACDVLMLDARRFTPQSRPRLFVVGVLGGAAISDQWTPSEVRPAWLVKFARSRPELRLRFMQLPPLPVQANQGLSNIVEQFQPNHDVWWDVQRLGAFLSSLSPINSARLEALRRAECISYAAAYRRTRKEKAVWEIRADNIAGCLRTTRGGSSKQALVEAGYGNARVRWMTAREYARLQGAPDLNSGDATESQAKFALGDAVCVPVIEWLARHYLVPVVNEYPAPREIKPVSVYA